MTSAPRSGAAAVRALARGNPRAGWIWSVTLALLLYLGFEGGGYDLVIRSNVGIIVWWTVLLSTLLGLVSFSSVSTSGRVAVLLFALFVAWSAASTIWSLSTERSLDEASRLATYLGVLWLGVTTFGPREQAIRHVMGAISVAITVIAAVALLARFEPNLIPSASTTGQLLQGAGPRLSWPLNYWNALGALMAFGCPLLLSFAVSARRLVMRCTAAAVLPLLALCAYLTFSRGAEIAGVVAIVIYLLLAPQRIPRLLTALLCAGGGAVLIEAAISRHAVENGVRTSAGVHQGNSLLVLTIVVCLAVGVGQLLLSRLVDRAGRRGVLTVPLRPARIGTVILVVLVAIACIATGVPHHLEHAWNGFKSTDTAGSAVHRNVAARFVALSGEGRYTFWKTGIDALGGRWLKGFGVGTFQLVWLPRAPISGAIINAHSLYVETLVEVGAIGLALLLAFLGTALGAAIRCVVTTAKAARCSAAAVVAAAVAFLVSVGFDWIWQVPVEPLCFLVLTAAVLAPTSLPDTGTIGVASRIGLRGATLAFTLGSLIVIGIPMAMTQAIRRSQTDANAGHPTTALAQAYTALKVEPGSSSAALQVALSLELERRYTAAATYAKEATSDDPSRWDAWLVQSRVEQEAGNARESVAAFRRARSLNPRSRLFD